MYESCFLMVCAIVYVQLHRPLKFQGARGPKGKSDYKLDINTNRSTNTSKCFSLVVVEGIVKKKSISHFHHCKFKQCKVIEESEN